MPAGEAGTETGGELVNYYIADTHFGHANIIRFCNRPFDDVRDMDRTMAEYWNLRVTDDDDVYIVGDFIYKSAEPAEEIIGRLRGRKHLVIGNHDAKWMKGVDLGKHFVEVDHALFTVDDQRRRIWMCHYPCMTWPKGSYHVYGHIHNDRPASFWPLLSTYENALNAGVDVNAFMPATLDELIANNARWRAEGLREDLRMATEVDG